MKFCVKYDWEHLECSGTYTDLEEALYIRWGWSAEREFERFLPATEKAYLWRGPFDTGVIKYDPESGIYRITDRHKGM